MHGQRLHPVQETGNEKAESLLSIQQTFIDNSMDVMIDSSRLVMDNENSPAGFTEDMFARLTQRLVYAFLGGYATMNELPCLDISILLVTFDASPTAFSPPEHSSLSTDDIEPLPKSSMNANLICNKSANGILNLDCPTTNQPFQLDDFPGNVSKTNDLTFLALHAMDFNSLASNSDPATVFESLAHEIQKISENQKAEIQEYDLHKHALTSGNLESQFHRHPKMFNNALVSNATSAATSKNRQIINGNAFSIPNPETFSDYLYGDLENPQFLDTESKLENSRCIIESNGEGPTYSVPDPSQLMNFLYGVLESPVFLSPESIEEVVHSTSNYADRYSDRSSEGKLISQSADHTIEESYQCSAILLLIFPSLVIPETIVGLMTGSLCDSNGFTNGMGFNRVRIPSNSQSAEKTSEISDSKLSYHRDIFIVADHFDKFTSEVHNTPATEPKGPLPKNSTTLFPTTSPLLYKSEDDEENMTTDLLSFASNTDEPSLMDKNSTINSYGTPDIYVSSKCCDQKACLLGDFYSDDDAEVEDLTGCMPGRLLTCDKDIFNTLNLPIESKNGSLIGAFKENEINLSSSISVECNGERISSDSSFFDSSDHDDLLEMYELSNQQQYTDTGYSCASPTWPEKMTTVSRGQTQKPLTCSIPGLAKNDNDNLTLTVDSSFFHSNTDETSVMNKNWTDEIFERSSENSVSLCHLNQMECAFKTSSFHYDSGSTDCVYSCSDDFEGSIKHQPLKNDGNSFKFAFPDPSSLTDYLFGSLDSPKFLASELLDGKIENLHFPSLFGDCEQGDRTEEADLSDRMIFDQFHEGLSKDDNSINKLPCSVELLGLISSSFDISDHDEFLEWYGINDQDQLLDGNWTCVSPTWPGKK